MYVCVCRLINILLLIYYKSDGLKYYSHISEMCSEECTERERQLKNGKQYYLRTLRMPDCGRLYSSKIAAPQSYIFFSSHFASIENSFAAKIVFSTTRGDTERIDKLSGSDDRPFYQRKISVVECFDVHESLLLMLSSNTGFDASLLSSRVRGRRSISVEDTSFRRRHN